jgi:hypothetical protein
MEAPRPAAEGGRQTRPRCFTVKLGSDSLHGSPWHSKVNPVTRFYSVAGFLRRAR